MAGVFYDYSIFCKPVTNKMQLRCGWGFFTETSYEHHASNHRQRACLLEWACPSVHFVVSVHFQTNLSGDWSVHSLWYGMIDFWSRSAEFQLIPLFGQQVYTYVQAKWQSDCAQIWWMNRLWNSPDISLSHAPLNFRRSQASDFSCSFCAFADKLLVELSSNLVGEPIMSFYRLDELCSAEFPSFPELKLGKVTHYDTGLMGFTDQGLAILTQSWDKTGNGYPSFYPRIASVAPSPGLINFQ